MHLSIVRRVPPGPMSFLHSHSGSTTWPKGIPHSLLIQRVTMSPPLRSSSFDRDRGLIQQPLSLDLCRLCLGGKEGGDSSAEATPSLLHLHSTRGRVPLPVFCHYCFPPTALNRNVTVGTSYRPTHAGPKAIKAHQISAGGLLRLI